MIDWGKVEEENGSKFKNYAPTGKYKVKCVDVDIKEVGSNGSIAQEFLFEEDDNYQYPKATHWLTFKEGKDGWRQWHNLNLIKMFGVGDSTAKSIVEKAEALNSKDKIVKCYETAYKSILKKKPEVEIEVFPDGKYSRAEFTDPNVGMPHDNNNANKTEDIAPADIEEDAIDLSDIPF